MTKYTFIQLSVGCLNSPAIAYNLCWQYLNLIELSSDTQVWNYNDDILLWGESLKSLIEDIEALTTTFTKRRWANAWPYVSVINFWASPSLLRAAPFPDVVKKKLLNLSSLSTLKKVQHLLGFFGSWRQRIPHLHTYYSPFMQSPTNWPTLNWAL